MFPAVPPFEIALQRLLGRERYADAEDAVVLDQQ
jgi:hypothetical protein